MCVCTRACMRVYVRVSVHVCGCLCSSLYVYVCTITLRACARGKVIGSVVVIVVDPKIAKSQKKIGVRRRALCGRKSQKAILCLLQIA